MRYRQEFAVAFRSGLTISQMIEVLNKLGDRRWNQRDSDRNGPYASSGSGHDDAREGINVIKIFDTSSVLKPETNGTFEIVCRIDAPSEVPDAWDSVRRHIEHVVLPAVGARDVVPTEPSD